MNSIKNWQKDNYHKQMMQLKEKKEMEEQFKKAQKPWAKLLEKVDKCKVRLGCCHHLSNPLLFSRRTTTWLARMKRLQWTKSETPPRTQVFPRIRYVASVIVLLWVQNRFQLNPLTKVTFWYICCRTDVVKRCQNKPIWYLGRHWPFV